MTRNVVQREDMFQRKPYKTVEEFYKGVEQLIQALKINGNTAEASRLNVLLHGIWTTGSELIGALMLSLTDMKGDFPKDIRRQIDDCRYFAKHHRRILGLDCNQNDMDAHQAVHAIGASAPHHDG
jgi:hypothetical protein